MAGFHCRPIPLEREDFNLAPGHRFRCEWPIRDGHLAGRGKNGPLSVVAPSFGRCFTLLDEGVYLCSERTMYRVLAENQFCPGAPAQRSHRREVTLQSPSGGDLWSNPNPLHRALQCPLASWDNDSDCTPGGRDLFSKYTAG